MKEIKLLDHNKEIVTKIEQAMVDGIRRIFFTEATGLGKTFVFMYLVNKYFKDKKVLYICPTHSIWERTSSHEEFENIKDCVSMCCFADFNIIKNYHYDYDVYFIDESHHLFSDIQGSNIVTISKYLTENNKNAYIFGMSATPYRYGKMAGDEFFDKTIHGKNLFEAIGEGLLQPINYAIAVDDIDRVGKEYEDLQEMKRYAKQYNIDTTKTAIKSLMNDFSYVNHWLLYFSKIEELEENIVKFKKNFPEYKIFVLHSKADVIDGVIDEFEAYEGKAILASVSMILEGIHLRTVEGVLSYRNVHSHNLFLQMIGRLGIMNKNNTPVFIDIYKSFMNIMPPQRKNNTSDDYEEFYNDGIKDDEYISKFNDQFNKCIIMHSSSYKLIDFSIALEDIYNPSFKEKTYRGITWINDRDLSRKLDRHDAYVGIRKRNGLSYEQIIDQVLDNKSNSYRGITWINGADLNRKLNKGDGYVSYYKRNGLSYEQIIDQVLDPKEYSYRGITWINDKELSIKLGKDHGYVGRYRRDKGLSCEEIIDQVLDTIPCDGSYRGITWINDTDLSRKLGMSDCYVSYYKRKGLSYEQIIDQALDAIPRSGSYRGITWNNNLDLSIKIGKSSTYISFYKKKGLSYEEIIDQVLYPKEYSYRGITWINDTDLSRKLGKDDKYVSYYKRKGLSHKEIIDRVLDKEKSYRGITWINDRDLSRKLDRHDTYVGIRKCRGLSYEQIIDQVLDPKVYSYRGITWINDNDLSIKLGKYKGYVGIRKRRGLSYKEIIDKVLDGLSVEEKSYRGITWTSNRDLSIKLDKNHSYVKYHIDKGLSYEQIIDQILG